MNCDVIITRDRYGNDMKVWMKGESLQRFHSEWHQIYNGRYIKTPAMIMSKQIFKAMFGYTLRHGAEVEANIIITGD